MKLQDILYRYDADYFFQEDMILSLTFKEISIYITTVISTCTVIRIICVTMQ